MDNGPILICIERGLVMNMACIRYPDYKNVSHFLPALKRLTVQELSQGL